METKEHLKRKLAIDKAKRFAKENGCEFIDLIKIKRYNKVKFRCGCGKEHSRATDDFYKYPKCVECANKNRFNNTVKSLPDSSDGLLPLYVREVFYNNGTKLVDERNRPLNHPDYVEDFTVDHIFPISAFMEHNIFDFKLVNSLKNLRPLSHSENCKKHNRYCKREFYKWLSENVSE